jgi:3-mercaptopropionate dioxygenase
MGTVTAALTPTATALVAAIRDAVPVGAPAEVAAPAVARVLARYVTAPDLLTLAQTEPDPHCYRQHVLHVEPDGHFSVVALVWLPGQRTAIHDHICWCVVGVRQGSEAEVLYREEFDTSGAAYLVATGSAVNGPGTTTYFYPPGDIHEVANGSDGVVISIHVYGADIAATGSSIRRRYDLPVRAAV